MIRVERIALPTGLRAMAERDADGVLVIYVSSKLGARQRRAAVLEAVRVSRREGSRPAEPAGGGRPALSAAWLLSPRLLPARLTWARLLALRVVLGPLGWPGRMAAGTRMRPRIAAGWAGAAAVVVAGSAITGLVLSTGAVPHQGATSLGSRPGVSAAPARAGTAGDGSGSRSGGSRSGGAGPAPGASAGASSGRAAAGSKPSSPSASQASPAPRPTSPAAVTTPDPSSSPSSSAASSPSPSATPAGATTGPCLSILVVGLCL